MRTVPTIVDFGFLLVLWAVALAFGGTDPLILHIIEVVIFLLSAVMLWRGDRQDNLFSATLLLALLPLAYVGMQWLLLQENRSTIASHALRLASYIAVFSVAYLIGQSRQSSWRVIHGLLALGLFQVLYGFTQYLLDWPYIFSYKNIYFSGRPTGTYINPNHFAGLLEMIFPLSVGLSLYYIETARSVSGGVSARIRIDSETIPRGVSYFFLSLLLFLGVIVSGSRMGIFSGLSALVAMVFLWSLTARRTRGAIPIFLAFVVGVVSLGLWLGVEPVLERYGGVEESYLARHAIWQDTIHVIQARPFLGSGLGTFALVYTEEQTTNLTRYMEHAHNDYLEFAVELGLLGSALLFGLIVLATAFMILGFRRATHGRTRYVMLSCLGSILAILVHSLADFNLQMPANAMIFAAILGLGCGIQEGLVRRHQHQ